MALYDVKHTYTQIDAYPSSSFVQDLLVVYTYTQCIWPLHDIFTENTDCMVLWWSVQRDYVKVHTDYGKVHAD
jgi:hypothetical protein